MSGPQGYVQARDDAAVKLQSDGADNNVSSSFYRTVENRPYFPLLNVDPTNQSTVIHVAKVIVGASCTDNNDDKSAAKTNTIDGQKQQEKENVTVVTGGLTNALFKVDLPQNSTYTSVLVRIFGGSEGLINRDEETTNFARLCHGNANSNNDNNVEGCGMKVVHDQLDLLGRFGNGRVETWVPNMRQAHYVHDMGTQHKSMGLALEVARQLATLHYGFNISNVAIVVPNEKEGNCDTSDHNLHSQPSLWKVIKGWIDELSQCLSHERFGQDASLMELFSCASVGSSQQQQNQAASSELIISSLSNELQWLKNRVETKFPHAPITFCHNDVNAANILLDTDTIDIDKGNTTNNDEKSKLYNKQSVCIIDYEYGSINYSMYDIANYTCEHCGGNDNGMPNFDLLPNSEWLIKFLQEYVNKRDTILDDQSTTAKGSKKEQVLDLKEQVELFQLASNLYWGVWGVLQAAGEVNDGTFQSENAKLRLDGQSDLAAWDNLRYGSNRLKRFGRLKRGVASAG